MSDDSKEIDGIHETILKTQAMYFALESLCVALVNTSHDRATVIKRFVALKESLTTSTLFDGEIDDAIFHEFDMAHERILDLLSTSSS